MKAVLLISSLLISFAGMAKSQDITVEISQMTKECREVEQSLLNKPLALYWEIDDFLREQPCLREQAEVLGYAHKLTLQVGSQVNQPTSYHMQFSYKPSGLVDFSIPYNSLNFSLKQEVRPSEVIFSSEVYSFIKVKVNGVAVLTSVLTSYKSCPECLASKYQELDYFLSFSLSPQGRWYFHVESLSEFSK